MKPDPAKLLGPLLRAVKADKPIPDQWREPLVKLVALLLSDRDAYTSVRAARVLIEMEAANLRLDRESGRTPTAVALIVRTAHGPFVVPGCHGPLGKSAPHERQRVTVALGNTDSHFGQCGR